MSSLGHKLGDKQIAGLDHKLGYSYACQLDSCALRPVFFYADSYVERQSVVFKSDV
jgi:hypothetical protein